MKNQLLQSLAVAFLGTGVLPAGESPAGAPKTLQTESAEPSEFEYKGMLSTSPFVFWRKWTKLDPLIRPLVDTKEDMVRKVAFLKKRHQAGDATDEQLKKAEDLYGKVADEYRKLSTLLAFDLWSRQSLSEKTNQARENANKLVQAFAGYDGKGVPPIVIITAVIIIAEEVERQIEELKKRNAAKLEKLVGAVRDDLLVPAFDDVPVAQ